MKKLSAFKVSAEQLELVWKCCLVLLLAFISILVFSLRSSITGGMSQDDGKQNLTLAYNLAYYGVFSHSENPETNLEPSNLREPLPVAFLAAYIRLHPELSTGQILDSINSDGAIIKVKYHNLFWAFLCLLGVGATTLISVNQRPAAFIAALAAIWLTYSNFLQQPRVIDRTYTEVQGGALLVCLSFALIRSLQTRKYRWFALTGALAGAMALTKAVFLYVGLGLVAALLVVFMVKQSRPDRQRFLKLTGVLVLSTAAVILPWMLRNRVLLGTWSVSSRGGSVLNIRAVKNQMNDTEYAGAFYYYAPPALQARIGNWLGFDEADLEEGGSLQRLNRAGDSDFGPRDLEAERAGRPEDAISFYRSARAEKVRLEMYYAEQGAENPSLLAEDTLQHRAMRMILSDPVKHLKTTLVFLWRGMWVEVRFRYIVAGFAAIWIMGLWGLLRRNSEMLGIALPSLGVYLFHGLFSHFIPRYSMILVPNMMIAMIVGAIWLCVFTINRYHSWVEARMSNQRNTAGKN